MSNSVCRLFFQIVNNGQTKSYSLKPLDELLESGFHDLRRAFATLNAGQMSPEVLQHLMQHQSFQTTRQYINLSRQLAPTLPRLYTPELSPAGQATSAEQSTQSGQDAG